MEINQQKTVKVNAEPIAFALAGIKAYRLAVERGDVVPPPKQTWEELAAYPETERGQAAARLIEKRAARREIFTGGDVSRRGTVAR